MTTVPAARTVRPPGLPIELEVLEGDAHVGPGIERGTYEPFETALFRAHLVPGSLVVDLGANVGWYGALAVLAGCRVEAFEPVPWIADVCERNLGRAAEAGPGEAVLHRAAAGSATGTARIALGPTNRGDNRLVDGEELPADLAGAETAEVPVVRVDDVVRGPARVLKVDTQGSEWHALQGARRLLGESHALALFLELWPYALRGTRPEELLGLLEEYGFTLAKVSAAPYPMRPERLLRQARERDPVRGGMDLYCTRGVPFHVGGAKARARSLWRRLRED